MASAGCRKETGLPSTSELAAVGALGAGQDVEQLVLALAFERGEAKDLARAQLEGDVVQLGAEAQVARDEPGRRRPRPRCRRPRPGRSRPSSPGHSPSISATIRSSEPSVTSTTPTVSPSRRTVARSQTAAISMRRCEMKMMERSEPRWRPMTSRTRSVRSAGSAAVISSSMSTSRLDREGAREVDDAQRGQRQVARHARQVQVGDAELREPVAERLERRLGQAEVVADVQVRDERRLLVDGDDAATPRLGGGVDVRARGRARGSGPRPDGRRRSGS